MKVIGITGGVGSGKSEVLNYLHSRYDAVIMEADRTGHELLSQDEGIARAVKEEFSESITDEYGRIDREKLGSLCFRDSKRLEKLNEIIHPAVKRRFYEEVKRAREQGIKIFVIEAALLIEGGYREDVDSLWYIYSNRKLRMQRLAKNRGYSEEKSRNIMENQLSEELYQAHSSVIIDNSGTLADMYSQVDRALVKEKLL